MGYAERRLRLEETFKAREEWWSRVFATPIATRVLAVVADWHVVTPNRLTLLSFCLTLLTSCLIILGSEINLICAGIMLQVAYIIDCMDGQLARYRGISSRAGSFLDKWSDFVKFPCVILALTLAAYNQEPSVGSIILGILCVFLTGYLPYLKLLAMHEAAIGPWNVLSGHGFLQRNLRFFLFEEAQWYLIVSVCLFFHAAGVALLVLAVTQGSIAIAQTVRTAKLVRKSDN